MNKAKFDAEIERHLDNVRALRVESGLFRASAQEVPTGYDKAWLRDNFYTSLGFEHVGDWNTVYWLWKAILGIFVKHHDKIEWAAQNKPYETWQYIHARYNPDTFDEFWEEWGNKQNDAVGAILFKVADLESRGIVVVQSDEERRMLQMLVNYLATIEYWHDPDNGVWEENEEVHASSIAPTVAALRKIDALPFIEVPEGMLPHGEQALKQLLPRESVTKFTDLALLSLIWPYQVVDDDIAAQILRNVEYHLERRRGVLRYKNDRYYNANEDGYSEEAEWTMGFPWLAVIYARRGNTGKAMYYLSKARSVSVEEQKLPELYFSNTDRPNENVPLGWAESLLIVAMKELEHVLVDETSSVVAA